MNNRSSIKFERPKLQFADFFHSRAKIVRRKPVRMLKEVDTNGCLKVTKLLTQVSQKNLEKNESVSELKVKNEHKTFYTSENDEHVGPVISRISRVSPELKPPFVLNAKSSSIAHPRLHGAKVQPLAIYNSGIRIRRCVTPY